MLPQCCAQLWFAPMGVWSFPRAVWVAVLMGKAVSGGCCHQKQNASLCHPTISTQPAVLRLYLHVYPLKGVSGILHCWFPKGRKKNLLGAAPLRDSKFPGGMWPWTEGDRCSWSWESSGLKGVEWAMEGGRKDLWLEPKARQLEIYSTAPSALSFWMWNSHWGVWRAVRDLAG